MAQKVAKQAVEMTIRVCFHCFDNLSIEMKIIIYSGHVTAAKAVSWRYRCVYEIAVAFDMLRDVRKSG